MVVCALDSKKPRDPDDHVKQQEVLYLITSYTFVASLHFMLDVVGACAGMSQIMRLKRRCVTIEDLFVDKCVQVLEWADRWEGPGWTVVDAMGQFSKTKKIGRPPKKKKKRGRRKRSQKTSEEDSNVNQAPSIYAPFQSLTQYPLGPSFFFGVHQNMSCPISSVFEGRYATKRKSMVHSSNPNPSHPWANPPKKNTLAVGTYKYVSTHILF